MECQTSQDGQKENILLLPIKILKNKESKKDVTISWSNEVVFSSKQKEGRCLFVTYFQHEPNEGIIRYFINYLLSHQQEIYILMDLFDLGYRKM